MPTIVVYPSVDSIGVGQRVQFGDTVLTSNGQVVTGATVVWGGTNPNVASVSITGAVVGIAQGKDTVEAIVGGGVGKAVLTVGPGSLAHIVVTPSAPTIRNGSTVALSAAFLDNTGDTLSGFTPVWTSTNTSIATVSSTGVVTGVAPGVDTIKATSAGVVGTDVVTVTAAPVGSIVVSPTPDTLQIGGTLQLTDTVKDVGGHVLKGQPVTWSTDAAGVASVTSSGRVTAVGAGTAQITAAAGGVTGSATIVVPLNTTPTTETYVFDRDTLVPFGAPYDISQHVRWVLKNASGDSVGAVGLASVSAVTYYSVLGNGAPGTCTVLAGTFVAYCPAGGSPAGAPSFRYNGYWSVTVHAKSVNGIPDQHNTMWWYVISGLPGSQPLTFATASTPTFGLVGSDTLNLAGLDTIRVTTAAGLVVATVPVVGWTSAVFAASGAPGLPGEMPGQPAPCTPGVAPTLIVCYPATGQSSQAVGYTALVSVTPGSFNGVANPAFAGTVAVAVQVPPPPKVSIAPTADTIAIGDTVVFVAKAVDPGVAATPVVSWACCADGILSAVRTNADTMITAGIAQGTSVVTAYGSVVGFSGTNAVGSASATVLVAALGPARPASAPHTHFVTLRVRRPAT